MPGDEMPEDKMPENEKSDKMPEDKTPEEKMPEDKMTDNPYPNCCKGYFREYALGDMILELDSNDYRNFC